LAGAVGPGVVAMSLLGIDIGTSSREVPPLLLVCRRMLAFSMQITQFTGLAHGKQNVGLKLLGR
jgi:hypothetical protein